MAVKILLISIVFLTFLIENGSGQDTEIPLIGSKAPSFTAETTNGEVTFPEDFGRNWKILFSHPQDFTPVCTTELLELAFMQPKFEKLGVKVAVISVDDIEQHNEWKRHLEDINFKGRGLQTIQFPIFEDPDGKASIKYGMIHKPASTSRDVRGVYIVDSENYVRSVNFYPIEIGRNMEEIIRIVEALQITDREELVSTPVNWEKGDDLLLLYKPILLDQNELNPKMNDEQYYSLDDMIWFKKAKDAENE